MIRLFRSLPLQLGLNPHRLVSPAAVILRPLALPPLPAQASVGPLLLAKKNHTSEDEEDSWVVEKDRRYEKSRYDREHHDEHIRNRRAVRNEQAEPAPEQKPVPSQEAALEQGKAEPGKTDPIDQDLHDINDEDEGVSNLHKDADKQASRHEQDRRQPRSEAAGRRQRYYSSQEDHDDHLRERDEEYEHRRGRPHVGRWEDDDRRPRRQPRYYDHRDDEPTPVRDEPRHSRHREDYDHPRHREDYDYPRHRDEHEYPRRRYYDDGHYGGRRHDEYDRRYQRRSRSDLGLSHEEDHHYDEPAPRRPRRDHDYDHDHDYRDLRREHERGREFGGRPRPRQRRYSSDDEYISEDGRRGGSW